MNGNPFHPDQQPPLVPALSPYTAITQPQGRLTTAEQAMLGRWAMVHSEEVLLPLFAPEERAELLDLAYRHMHGAMPRPAATRRSTDPLWQAIRAYLTHA